MQPSFKKPGTDIIQELLEDALIAFPVSPLLIGLYKQYAQRGFLTKKQLQGLYNKASGIPGINTARLATLEAIIKKMPNRFKSELPVAQPEEKKDEHVTIMIQAILKKYPQHKRVLFLKSKFENNEMLSVTELAELQKFQKMLK